MSLGWGCFNAGSGQTLPNGSTITRDATAIPKIVPNWRVGPTSVSTKVTKLETAMNHRAPERSRRAICAVSLSSETLDDASIVLADQPTWISRL